MQQTTSKFNTFLFVAISVILSLPGSADDRSVADQLRQLGGEVKMKDGVVTEISFRNSRALGEEHWKTIGKLSGLTRLTAYGHAASLNDATVGYLTSLQSLQSLSLDGAQLSDKGLERIAEIESLTSVAFFHLSFRMEGFTGKGFAAWKSLPKLQRLTVAGMSMGDEGFEAISKLKSLQELRTWHTYRTNASHALIAKLPKLKTLKVGQRLPGNGRSVCLNDNSIETITQIQTLEQLEVGEANFTIGALKQLAALPKLNRLKIDRTELTESDIATLRASLSNVKIDFKPITADQRKKLVEYLK